MGLGDTINKTVVTWGVMGVSIVLLMIILNKFKDVSGNTTDTNATVELFKTGIKEPANWVVIVVIAIIGFGIVKFMQKRKGWLIIHFFI